MDKKERQAIIDQAAQQEQANQERALQAREEVQVAHCEKLDALEARGIDLDSLVEVYGKWVLTPQGGAQVERLSRILEAIDNPGSSVLIVGETKLGTDDSVFDRRDPKSIVKARFILFEDPSTCKVEFVKDEPNQQTSLLIRGIGYTVSDMSMRRVWPNPDDEPAETIMTIAQRYYGNNRGKQILSTYDYNLLEVLDPNDESAKLWHLDQYLTRGMFPHFPEAGEALKWFMNYNTPEDRQRHRERSRK